MSVLNTFALVFETEGDQTTLKTVQQLDAAGQKLAKTNQKTGDAADKSGKQAKSAAQQFVQFKRALAGAIAPALTLGVVLSRTLNFAAQGEQLLFMAKSANMAAGEFQKLAIANERFGGTREGAAGMMAGLAGQIQALKFGQSAPLQDAAVMYGLNLAGSNGRLAEGNELLRNVARTMERLDAGAQLDLGRRIGLDEATIRVLQRGVKAFDEELARAEKRRIFTEADLKRAQEMEMALRDAKLSFQAIWAEIARWLLPAVQEVVTTAGEGMEYLSRHGDVIKAGLAVISAIMAGIAVSSLAAVAPWLGMAALIAAVGAAAVLAYDDFMTFCQGGESLLAPFWSKLVDFGRWWQDLPAWMDPVKKALAWVLNPLEALKSAISGLKMAWGGLMDLVAAAPDWLKNWFTGKDSFGVSAAMSAIGSNPMASVPAGSAANAVTRNSTDVRNQFNLTVSGSANPAKDGAYLLDRARGESFAEFTSGQEA